MADAKLSALPAGAAIADADLFYSAQAGSSVRQAASAVKTYLLAAVGGSYQPLDADLTAIAALTGTNTIYYRSAANTWSPVTFDTTVTFSGGILGTTGLLTTAAAASTYQPLDGDLTSLAAAAGTNTIYYRSAIDTWSPVTVSTGLTFSGGALAATGGIPRSQRLQTGTTITVGGTDQIINCNIASGAAACTLPLANTRAGVPVTFKDVGGQFTANPLTITRTAPDTIEGLTSVTLSNNYAALTLTPANDGTTAGWFVT